MTRIVVQRPTGAAGLVSVSHLLLAAAIACAVGCSHRVRVVPDLRVRPCGIVVDPAGVLLDRSQVSWMSPDDIGDRAKLDAWCNTVGPVVVGGPRLPSPILADRLIVVGWNVHLGAGDVVRLVDDLRGGRIGDKAADAPIVLLLQETFRSGEQVPAPVAGTPVPHRLVPDTAPRRSALEIAAELQLNVYYLPTMRNGRGAVPVEREDRGLAIMSSLSLHDLRAIELPFERQRRPAAVATVRLATSSRHELSLRVVNLHLESRSGARRLWMASPQARNRQVEALTASLRSDVATLLEGDLNTWANREPALEHLGREFTPCTDGRPTFAGGLHLDWVFARLPDGWTVTCRRLDQKYGSDHYPIVAVVKKATRKLGPTPALSFPCDRYP
jgi:endonuclease/exonuclease/phosphatase family metal-dependent hydrolase